MKFQLLIEKIITLGWIWTRVYSMTSKRANRQAITLLFPNPNINNTIDRTWIKTYPVHKVWPRTPPRITPATSLTEAITMVASWDRSPHSAKKMRPKALTKTLKIFKHCFPNLDDSGFFSAVESECGSTSGSGIAEKIKLAEFGKNQQHKMKIKEYSKNLPI